MRLQQKTYSQNKHNQFTERKHPSVHITVNIHKLNVMGIDSYVAYDIALYNNDFDRIQKCRQIVMGPRRFEWSRQKGSTTFLTHIDLRIHVKL